MTDPTDGGVDTPTNGAAAAPTFDAEAMIETITARVAEAIKPLHDDVEAVRRVKVDTRNKKLNDEVAERDAQIAALNAKIQGLSPDTAETKDALLQAMRDDLAAQMKRSEEIAAQFQGAQRKLKRKELEDQVLADVAPAHRDVALDLLEGTLSRKNINIDETDDLSSIVDALKKKIAATLSVPQVQSNGGATMAPPGAPIDPGKVEWLKPDGSPTYANYGDIPDEVRHLLPPEVFQKMVKPSNKDFGGLNL